MNDFFFIIEFSIYLFNFILFDFDFYRLSINSTKLYFYYLFYNWISISFK